MKHSPQSLDHTDTAAAFLQQVRGLSFSQIGVYALIRANMLLTPDFCMTRAGIHSALRTRTPFSIELVASVIADLCETGPDGAIYLPGLDAERSS